MKTGLIYIIKNKVNDKVYIGQTTTTLQTRFCQHCKKSTLKTRHYKLYNAIKKYGVDKFYIELLESNIPIQLLNKKEIEYIQKYQSYTNGYNCTKGGDGRTINTDYDEFEIVRLYTGGFTEKEIGKKFNVSNATISRTLKRLGMSIRHDGNKYERFGKEFVHDWDNSMTIPNMAIKYGVHERTIRRHVTRLGLKPRGKGYQHTNKRQILLNI